MRGQRFRLRTFTLGAYTDGNHRVFSLPTGAIVQVLDDQLGGVRLAEVSWRSRTVMMFSYDLENYCDLLV